VTLSQLTIGVLGGTGAQGLDIDVLVLGNDPGGHRSGVRTSRRDTGRARHLRWATAQCWPVEALTANLLVVHKRHQAHAGIRITGP
jgi:hypothetical protein